MVSPMPPVILLPENEDDDYEHFAATFRGEIDGAEAKDIWASITASQAVTSAIDGARRRAGEEGGAGRDA